MLQFPRFTVQRRESRLIMHTQSCRGLHALMIGFIGVVLHAQETWQVRPSDVTNNLWSVVYTANQWVAVGAGHDTDIARRPELDAAHYGHRH